MTSKWNRVALLPALAFAILSGSARADCLGGINFLGSCAPPDFVFVPATTDGNMNGYFWSRCSFGSPTRTDSKWDAQTQQGVDNGMATGCGAAGFFEGSGGGCSQNDGQYVVSALGWGFDSRYDGCPIEDPGLCGADMMWTSETLFLMTNGSDPASVPAKFALGIVQLLASGDGYDIDSISGNNSVLLCWTTCQKTLDGGATWASCVGGGVGESNTGFSIAPTIASANGTDVTLIWSLPAIRANTAGLAWPISSWSVYRIDSASTPTDFSLPLWTEVYRAAGNATTATFAYGPPPTNRYYFSLLPNFDGDGGLNAGAGCAVGVDCTTMSSNTWQMGTAPGTTHPKVGPPSNSIIIPGGSSGSFVATSATYSSLQKVTIGFTTSDETGIVSLAIRRGAGTKPTTWVAVGNIPPQGAPSTYSFADTALPRQRTFGQFTYRIDAIDLAGAVAYTIDVPVGR